MSITPAIYFGLGFFVWDRWMYFVIIPMSYLAYFGISILAKYIGRYTKIDRQAVITICLLIVLWKPIAFLYSGVDNSAIAGINLPDDEITDNFPKTLSDNSLQNFNDPINYNFVAQFNKLNSANNQTVIDHSISGILKIGGIKVPLTEAFYGKLSTENREALEKRDFTFYAINDNFGLKDWNRINTLGTITVYQFDKVEKKSN